MRKHTWAYLVAVLLIWLFFAQAVGNLSAQSPVVDEPSHIARAMAYWRTGDLRLQLGHPPLMHALAGLPLLLEPGAPDVTTLPGWEKPFDRGAVSYHTLWDSDRPADRIVFLTRWPVLMLAVLLGALIFRWSGERFGLRAAFVALFLFTFDPNLLAHSVLITTDLVVTFFILLALYSFDRWLRWSSIRWLIIAGITLGLALVSKFSAVLLLPVIAILGLASAWQDKRWMRMLASLAIIVAIGAVVVWAVYRFEAGPFKPLPVNVPAPNFLSGLLRVQERDEEGRIAFLLGEMRPKGWWYYFPVAFAVKTPLPTLILLGLAIIGAIIAVYRLWKQGKSNELTARAWSLAPLWLLPALYLTVSMRSSVNVGYRYILPVLPFLFVLISGFTPSVRTLGRSTGASVWHLILGLWLIVEAALIFPYHLAYFNEIVGGPDNGYKVLADSNVDWGQDIKRLKIWLDDHHIAEAHLAVFTGSEPERYGIQVIKLPGPYQSPNEYGFHRFAPEPGVYVLGASSWQGLRLDNPDTYDWFRRQEPVARIGHSLFVYDVHSTPATEKWAAVCYAPDGPIDGDGLAAGFGRTDMRSIFFDCRNSWVYLHDAGPGYYIVPAHGDRTIASEMLLGRATPIYHDRGDPVMSKDVPGFTLYRWDGEPDVSAKLASLTKPPGGVFDFGVASLIGYELDGGPFEPGSTIFVTTWWHANSPGEVLLSSYSHLMNGDRLEASGDGLGVPPQMWQPGDVIVQRHTFKLRDDLLPGDYPLHVGLYSVENNQRYPLLTNGDEHPSLVTLQIRGK